MALRICQDLTASTGLRLASSRSPAISLPKDDSNATLANSFVIPKEQFFEMQCAVSKRQDRVPVSNKRLTVITLGRFRSWLGLRSNPSIFGINRGPRVAGGGNIIAVPVAFESVAVGLGLHLVQMVVQYLPRVGPVLTHLSR